MTEQPKHTDNTRTLRQQRRRERLDQKAHELGFASWSHFETAVLHELHVEVYRERSTPGIIGKVVKSQ